LYYTTKDYLWQYFFYYLLLLKNLPIFIDFGGIMIIKPLIRSNLLINSHPLGCKAMIEKKIDEASKLEPIENGPKNVLIIGGSSGYGLGTRIVLAVCSSANTINVSYEKAPKGKSTGSAGWWNNLFFEKAMANAPSEHSDFNGDAFSMEMKNQVIETVKKSGKKIDLVVYSLASGIRPDYESGETIRSSLKPIGETFTGSTLDIKSMSLKDITVEAANEEEINNTVFVMGGDDWSIWIKELINADVLADHVKTIAYTYIGGEITEALYRNGTIGSAKKDLEATCKKLDKTLSEKYEGSALISSSKAVTTKASIFIPAMPLYMAALYTTMLDFGTHENILEHKYRLFSDMVYGQKPVTDDEKRLRPDMQELDKNVQNKIKKMMADIDADELIASPGGQIFLDEFYQLNGFNVPDVDYSQDVDIQSLI
jgi:enoyl-[acyl-carrier protein] reductase/trans-2-enoyl-CoA reductase (NAD+)